MSERGGSFGLEFMRKAKLKKKIQIKKRELLNIIVPNFFILIVCYSSSQEQPKHDFRG